MASSDEVLKDQSISDVINTSKRSSPSTDQMPESENSETVETEKNKPNSGSGERMKRDEKNSEEPAKLTRNVSSLEGVDLSNPEHVIHLLETVDLSEEDTEILLQEAYKMNKKLKELMRRQDRENCGAADHKGKPGKVNGKEKSASSSSSGSRTGSAFTNKKILPPISGEREATEIYTVKLRRAKTNVQDMRPHISDTMIQRSKSSKPVQRGAVAMTTKKTKSTEPRPQWNDRFSYT